MLPARSLPALVIGAATVMLAACGSNGPSASGQTGSGPSPGDVTFAKCMRGHGVSQFPDPGNPVPAGSSISIMGAHLPANTKIGAPAFRVALNTCMKTVLAGHPRPPVTAAQKAAALRFARCMRANGEPHFPDPKFPAGGGIGIAEPVPGPAFNPSSPAVQHADKVCGHP